MDGLVLLWEAVVGGERWLCMCYGGKLDDGGAGKVTHVGGWTKYIVLKESVGLEEVRRMVSEITNDILTVHKLWYSLKYDRGIVMELEGDGDLRMFLKGNDERGYLYVGDDDGPKRRAQKATWSYDHGVVYGRSERDRDDMVQKGRKGVGLKRLTSQPENSSNIVRNYGIRVGLCSYWVVSCDPTSAPVCIVMMKFSFACSILASLPYRRQIFNTVNHALQPINPWVIDKLQPWLFALCL
ncbi:hypothetical protein Cgig2_022751 [Carnegiea gigantea]|uniref:Uncharacterized protein n=1 Tax=Carnegiea gigantea TaxID=171969 RepID=A0A9Q1QHU2_9CARY|nr:hypothetical protein Cgig2_022751 [Carnegiea gigantea]